LSRRRCVLI